VGFTYADISPTDSCDPHHIYPVLKPHKVIRNTSLILVLHNNGCTGIDQMNIYSRRLKMTKQKQMTQKELDQVSGGPNRRPYDHQHSFLPGPFNTHNCNRKYTNSNGASIGAGKWEKYYNPA
jgi:bacteriocin-like protein